MQYVFGGPIAADGSTANSDKAGVTPHSGDPLPMATTSSGQELQEKLDRLNQEQAERTQDAMNGAGNMLLWVLGGVAAITGYYVYDSWRKGDFSGRR